MTAGAGPRDARPRGELLNLEEPATRAVGEFLFVAAPLKIRGGVGSPLNPLAVL